MYEDKLIVGRYYWVKWKSDKLDQQPFIVVYDGMYKFFLCGSDEYVYEYEIIVLDEIEPYGEEL